jgi:hypothetical protein
VAFPVKRLASLPSETPEDSMSTVLPSIIVLAITALLVFRRELTTPRPKKGAPRAGTARRSRAREASRWDSGYGCSATWLISQSAFHHISQQHLKRYLAESDFRYNDRSALGINDKMRAAKAVKGVVGKRLTYHRPDEAAYAYAKGA